MSHKSFKNINFLHSRHNREIIIQLHIRCTCTRNYLHALHVTVGSRLLGFNSLLDPRSYSIWGEYQFQSVFVFVSIFLSNNRFLLLVHRSSSNLVQRQKLGPCAQDMDNGMDINQQSDKQCRKWPMKFYLIIIYSLLLPRRRIEPLIY